MFHHPVSMFHALTNHEIAKILSTHSETRNIFEGFLYPRDVDYTDDELDSIKTPSLYVINTDYIKGPGEHWVLILYLHEKSLFFDPFGLSPDTHDFPFVVERDNNEVGYNIFTVQNFESRSVSCGHFVILYAILLCQGYTLKSIEKLFSSDKVLNDVMAIEIVTWLFHVMNL